MKKSLTAGYVCVLALSVLLCAGCPSSLLSDTLNSVSQTSELYADTGASTGAMDEGETPQSPTVQPPVLDYSLANYLNLKEGAAWLYRYTTSSSQAFGGVSVVGKVQGIKYDAYELAADAVMTAALPKVIPALEEFSGSYYIAFDAGIAYISQSEESLTESFDADLWVSLGLPKELKASLSQKLIILNSTQETLIPEVGVRSGMADLEGPNGASVCFVEGEECAQHWVFWPGTGLVYGTGSDGGYLSLVKME